MFQQIYTIARNTFTESIRMPVFVVLTLATALLLILSPSLAAYTLDDDNKLMIDMGLSTLFLAGLLLAAFTATGVLSREVENKTVLTVVSKPVARPVFVVGKYLGVAAALAMTYWILTIVFLLTVRHGVMQTASDRFDIPVLVFGLGGGIAALLLATLGNYFYHWVFTSSLMNSFFGLLTGGWFMVLCIQRDWSIQIPGSDLNGQLMIGLLLVFLAVLVLTAVAIAVSTRLGQIMTILICVGTFVVGLVSQYLLGKWAARSVIADVFYRVVPNFQLLWPADALTQGHDFTLQYVLSVAAYAALMIGAILSLAVCLFQNREVG